MIQGKTSRNLVFLGVLLAGACLGFVTGRSPFLPIGVLGCLGFAIIGWRYPVVMITLLGSTLLLAEKGILGVLVIPWTVSKLLVAAAISVWFLRQVYSRNAMMSLGRETLAMAFILMAMVTSIFVTIDMSRTLISFIPAILCFMLLHFVSAVADEFDTEKITLFLLPSALFCLVYGIFFGDLDNGRLIGMHHNANLWATSLDLFCLPILGLLAGMRRPLATLCFGLMLLLLMTNVTMAASRSSLLALIPTVPFLLLPFRKNLGLFLVFIVPAVLCFVVFTDFSVLLERMQTAGQGGAEFSSMHREEAAWLGLTIFEQNWLFGTGSATFPLYFAVESSSGFHHEAHNMYIKTMAETGIIGTGAVLFLFVHIANTMIQVLRKAWNTRLEGVALGLAAMLVAWLILGLFADLFVDTIVYFYLGLLFALNRKLSKPRENHLLGPVVTVNAAV